VANESLRDFRSFLADFRGLSSLGLKATAVAPFAGIWLKTGLPLPGLMAGLTSLAEFITVMCLFQAMEKSTNPRLKKGMYVGIWFSAASMLGLLIVFVFLTMVPGSGQDRKVKGFVVQPNVAELINGTYTVADALRDTSYDPEKVWTTWSVKTSEILLQLFWLGTFISLASVLTCFSMLERRRLNARSPEKRVRR
jgi:hypothetical protein